MAFKKLPIKTNSTTTQSWGFVGEAAIAQAEKEEKAAKLKAQTRNLPYRFSLKPSDSAEVIILENGVHEWFGLFEHEIVPNNDYKARYWEISPKTMNQEDPLEQLPIVNGAISKPYFINFMTVLHLNYTKQDGTVIPVVKKMLPIKGRSQREEFKKLSDMAIRKYGTMRGLHLKLSRTDDTKSPRIGVPGVLDTMEYGHFSETELIAKYGHEPIVSKVSGKVIIPKNGNLQTYKWLEIFPTPTTDYIREKYGIQPPLGSKVEKDSDTAFWESAADHLDEDPTDLDLDPETETDIPY